MNPPPQYKQLLPIIDRVFESGIAPYVHATGFNATRIITNVTNISQDKIDPFYTPGNPARGNLPGNYRLFTADMKENSFLETLGHSGDGPIPHGTYELHYRLDGLTLNFERIVDSEFRQNYSKTGGSSEENRIFSQCVDYYLESKGLTSQFDTYGWLSISGQTKKVSGYVHAWKSKNTGSLQHIETIFIPSR